MNREMMPTKRRNWTQKVKIGGHTFYLTCGEYGDGRLGEIFINCSKTGTFTQGILDALARVISTSIQHGTPLEPLVHALELLNFPPNGQVIGSDVSENATSVTDWVSQEISVIYCSGMVPEKVYGYVAESWRSGA